MKKLTITLLSLIISLTVLASPRPYTKEQSANEKRLDVAEAALDVAEAAFVAADSALDLRLDDLELGGYKRGVFTVSTTKAAASTFSAGVTIPTGSLIIGLYARVKTLIVSADANTIALGCASGAGLLAATDYSAQAANYVLAATSTMPYHVSSACAVTGTVGAGASGITAGAFEVYVHYLDLL